MSRRKCNGAHCNEAKMYNFRLTSQHLKDDNGQRESLEFDGKHLNAL